MGRTTSIKSEGRACDSVVGPGIGALVMPIMFFWVLGRRRARDELTPGTPAPPEPEEGVEAAPLEEEVVVVPPGPPSAEDVSSPREDPPAGEERPGGFETAPMSLPTL